MTEATLPTTSDEVQLVPIEEAPPDQGEQDAAAEHTAVDAPAEPVVFTPCDRCRASEPDATLILSASGRRLCPKCVKTPIVRVRIPRDVYDRWRTDRPWHQVVAAAEADIDGLAVADYRVDRTGQYAIVKKGWREDQTILEEQNW